ncbi:MAG: hypothetical protein ACLP0J_02110 [Solirubrobacteraceae bacterium]
MVDPRIYRATLAIVAAAVIVFGFSFRNQPGAATTTLAPAALNGNGAPSLATLAKTYSDRSPGSVQDGLLADDVASQLQTDGFSVSTSDFNAQTADGPRTLETVTGTRTGQADGTIVVVSDRDEPGQAGLSGTYVMLELAGVLAGADQNRSLMLVSTSGSVGAAGTTQLARSLAGQPIDAVIVLGDLAGAHVTAPVIVPWSDGEQLAPLLLRNTLSASIRSLAGLGSGAVGIGAQLAHLAFPFSTTEQGPFGANGIPAVMLSTSGNRDPTVEERPSASTISSLGEALLQTIDALNTGPAVPAPTPYLTVAGKFVPAWAVSLLVLALIVPVLATTVDALARARRRGHSMIRWVLWVLSGAVPFLAAFALVLVIRVSGWLPATPPGPVGAGGVPLGGAGIAALAAVLLVIVASFAWLRPLCVRLAGEIGPSTPDRRPGDGAVVALAIVMCLTTILIWVLNPFAAALVVPALHMWLWLTDPRIYGRRAVKALLAALGLLAPALVVFYYAQSLGLPLIDVPWNGLLLFAAGQIGPLAAVYWSVLLGCFASAVAITLQSAPQRERGEPLVTTRGPITYAGPGSLGGTSSALRRCGA